MTAWTRFVIELVTYFQGVLSGRESGWSLRNSFMRIFWKHSLRNVKTKSNETPSVCHSRDLDVMLSPM